MTYVDSNPRRSTTLQNFSTIAQTVYEIWVTKVFHFLALGGLILGQSSPKGRRPGGLRDLPSCKISSLYANPRPRYPLLKFCGQTKKQTVNDISPACLSACGDNKEYFVIDEVMRDEVYKLWWHQTASQSCAHHSLTHSQWTVQDFVNSLSFPSSIIFSHSQPSLTFPPSSCLFTPSPKERCNLPSRVQGRATTAYMRYFEPSKCVQCQLITTNQLQDVLSTGWGRKRRPPRQLPRSAHWLIYTVSGKKVTP